MNYNDNNERFGLEKKQKLMFSNIDKSITKKIMSRLKTPVKIGLI